MPHHLAILTDVSVRPTGIASADSSPALILLFGLKRIASQGAPYEGRKTFGSPEFFDGLLDRKF